jgi:hypothetical protein
MAHSKVYTFLYGGYFDVTHGVDLDMTQYLDGYRWIRD